MTSLRQALLLQNSGVISLVGAGGKSSLMFRLARELSNAGAPVLTTTTTKIYEPGPDQSPCVIVSNSLTQLLDKAAVLTSQYPHVTMALDRLPDAGKLIGLPPQIVDAIWKKHLFQWILVEADGAAGRPLKAPSDHEPVIPACTSCLVGLTGLSGIGRPLNEQWIFRSSRFAELAGMRRNARVTETAVADVIAHQNGILKNAPSRAARIVFLNQADTPEDFAAGQRIARLLTEKIDTGIKRVVIGQIRADSPVMEIFEP